MGSRGGAKFNAGKKGSERGKKTNAPRSRGGVAGDFRRGCHRVLPEVEFSKNTCVLPKRKRDLVGETQ